jgi:hypothetical protein
MVVVAVVMVVVAMAAAEEDSLHRACPEAVNRSGATVSAAAPEMTFAQPFIDQPRGAADSGSDADRRYGAVFRAGAALHAGVEV